MNKICIVGTYFGKLPAYFHLWLISAKNNPTIDFFIVGDNEFDHLPSNVKYLKTDLKSLQQLATEKLGFEACLNRYYKICDYKPAYGLLFEEYLDGYDYWGHCDFDLIWGDLQSFFDRYDLYRYDKFLPQGHLGLYRNTKENNRRFMLDGSLVGDYKTVYTTERNYSFDEVDGVLKIFLKHGFKVFNERPYVDVSSIYKRFKRAMSDDNYDRQVFYYQDKKVYRKALKQGKLETDEFLYIHFKQRGEMPVTNYVEGNERFLITPQGFICLKDEEIDLTMIDLYNPYPGLKVEQKELNRFKRAMLKRRIELKLNSIFHTKEKLR